MAKTIRFHLDESVSTKLAAALRQRNIDVTTPSDASLLGAPDEEHLEYASTNERVLITHDVDFLRLHQQGRNHWGIAYCQQRKHSLKEMLATLVLMEQCLQPDDMRDEVCGLDGAAIAHFSFILPTAELRYTTALHLSWWATDDPGRSASAPNQ